MTRVIGIDPGYDRLGVAVLDRTASGEVLIHSTCIETDRALSIPKRLMTLGTALETLLVEYQPSIVGIENLFFNKNQKTAIGVAQARGMILYLAQKHGCSVAEFGPQEIKIAVTGYGKSDKKAMVDMVKRLVQNAPQKALDDEYDAIAVGITCLAHHRNSPR